MHHLSLFFVSLNLALLIVSSLFLLSIFPYEPSISISLNSSFPICYNLVTSEISSLGNVWKVRSFCVLWLLFTEHWTLSFLSWVLQDFQEESAMLKAHCNEWSILWEINVMVPMKNWGVETTFCPCKFMAEHGDSWQFNIFITKPPDPCSW